VTERNASEICLGKNKLTSFKRGGTMKRFKSFAMLLAVLVEGPVIFAQSQAPQKGAVQSGPPMMMCQYGQECSAIHEGKQE